MTTKHFSSGQALDWAACVGKKLQWWRAPMAQGEWKGQLKMPQIGWFLDKKLTNKWVNGWTMDMDIKCKYKIRDS